MAAISLARRFASTSFLSRAASFSAAQLPRNLSYEASTSENPDTDGKPPLEIVAELTNAPKYMLKEELLTILKGCNLNPDRAYTVLDEKLRIRRWRLEFLAKEDYNRAQRILTGNPRIGPRFVKLSPLTPFEARPLFDTINTIVKNYRDRSLLLIGPPDDLRVESIERFFHGYDLAPRGIWHFWVDMGQPGVAYSRAQARQRDYNLDSGVSNTGRERRTLVKFSTRMEALRALRERQGGFLQDKSVELRLIQ